MKKLVCLLLSLCLLAVSFAGCGDKTNKEGDQSSSSQVGQPATVSPSPSPEPQTAKAVRVTADSGLNVRAQPSTDSEVLDMVDNGQRLALLTEDPQDGWYQVQYKGQTAYISAEYAEVIEVTVEEYNQLRNGTDSSTTSESSSSEGSESSSSSESSTSSASQTDNSSSSSESSSSTSPNSVNSEDGE